MGAFQALKRLLVCLLALPCGTTKAQSYLMSEFLGVVGRRQTRQL